MIPGTTTATITVLTIIPGGAGHPALCIIILPIAIITEGTRRIGTTEILCTLTLARV